VKKTKTNYIQTVNIKFIYRLIPSSVCSSAGGMDDRKSARN